MTVLPACRRLSHYWSYCKVLSRYASSKSIEVSTGIEQAKALNAEMLQSVLAMEHEISSLHQCISDLEEQLEKKRDDCRKMVRIRIERRGAKVSDLLRDFEFHWLYRNREQTAEQLWSSLPEFSEFVVYAKQEFGWSQQKLSRVMADLRKNKSYFDKNLKLNACHLSDEEQNIIRAIAKHMDFSIDSA